MYLNPRPTLSMSPSQPNSSLRSLSQHRVVAALFACALLPLSLHADPRDDLETFSDRLTVRLVEVEVLVSDRDGVAVHGLVAEDFELLVDEEPVPLSHFVAPTPRRRPAAPTTRATEAAGESTAPTAEKTPQDSTSLVIYLDLAYLRPGELRDLAEPLQIFLASQLAAGSRLTLMAADRGLETLRALQAPLPPLLPIFDQIATRIGRGERLRQEYDDIRNTIARTLDDEEFDPLLDRQPNRGLRLLMARIENFADSAHREAEITTAQLRFLTSSLAGLPGRKMVLYVGGRMPLDAGRTLADAWQRAFGPGSTRRINTANSGQPTATAAPSAVFQFDVVPALDLPDTGAELFSTLATEASSQGVVFYTFDASRGGSGSGLSLAQGDGALEAVTGTDWDFSSTQRAGHQRALATLAVGSGGKTLGGRRDLAALLEVMGGHLEGGYLLAFEPPPSAEEEPRRLRIRLRNGKLDLLLQYRHFFRHRPPDREAADRTLTALLLHATQPPPENPLELTLEVGERRKDVEGEDRLPITLRVPFSRLALNTETWAHSGQLSIFFTAGGLKKGTLPVRKAVLPLRVANEQLLEAFGRQVEYQLEVELPEGADAVAVSVRDDLAPTLSTVVHPLDPPATSGSSKVP